MSKTFNKKNNLGVVRKTSKAFLWNIDSLHFQYILKNSYFLGHPLLNKVLQGSKDVYPFSSYYSNMFNPPWTFLLHWYFSVIKCVLKIKIYWYSRIWITQKLWDATEKSRVTHFIIKIIESWQRWKFQSSLMV